MPSFLLTISFLLHIILLITVYYLFQQIQLLKQDHTKELTGLFETYLKEIKNENRRLEDEFKIKNPSNREIVDEKNMPDRAKENMIINELDEPALKTDEIDDTFETSLEAQILQLYHQGIEVEQIAKKLNCGKTEAALIINLYKKRNHKA